MQLTTFASHLVEILVSFGKHSIMLGWLNWHFTRNNSKVAISKKNPKWQEMPTL